MVLGDYLTGRTARLAKAKAAATRRPAPAREPTPVPTEPPAGGVRPVNGAKKEAEAAESNFRKSGKTSDLAKRFVATARASRAT